tara:strand:+ start:71 stop:199 length:129 start_codon:yes stop_codon:yes gene_type:complete
MSQESSEIDENLDAFDEWKEQNPINDNDDKNFFEIFENIFNE